MIFYTVEIVYSVPNLTPKHNPHRKLSAFLLCQKHNSVWFTSCFPHGDITENVLPGSHTQTHPNRAAHAALVTVVGLHLQHMRAARLSVQSHSSSADESRQTVHAKLTIVSYREQTSHTHMSLPAKVLHMKSEVGNNNDNLCSVMTNLWESGMVMSLRMLMCLVLAE